MARLTIVADIKARQDRIELVKSELIKLIGPTRAEAGCITYDLHQDNTDPAQFLFFEIWENRDLWQDHMNASHIAAFGAATEDAIESVSLKEMTEVG